MSDTSANDIEQRLIEKAPDSLLASLVEAVNTSKEDKERPGYTLQMGGLLVTGELIPNWVWASSLHNQAERAAGEALPGSPFKIWQEQLEAGRDEDAAVGDDEWKGMTKEEQDVHALQATPAFIHLRDARLLTQGTFIPGNGTLWRGRLSEVDAWFVGLLSTTPEN